MKDESCLSRQPFGLTPVYYWQGALPWLLALDSSQAGWVVALVCSREGACCLLPVAWLRDAPGWDDDRFTPGSGYPAFAADALDGEMVKLALAELAGEGWEVSGRLDVHFTGRLAEPDFWPGLESYFWQRPRGEMDGA